MPGRGGPTGGRARRRAVVAGCVPVLVAAVLLVRPGTAAEPAPASAWSRGSGPVVVRGTGGAGGGGTRPDTVLRRGGTSAVRLGQPVEDLAAEGWQPARPAVDGCEELARPTVDGVLLRAWALRGRVVAVRLEAPTTPGLVLPTAVLTGWSLDAVRGGSDGLLVARAVPGPAGEPATVLTGRLPVDAWPPETAAPQTGPDGRAVAAEPAPPVVDLVLGDAGTGRVVSAEVRVPAAGGCPGTPGAG